MVIICEGWIRKGLGFISVCFSVINTFLNWFGSTICESVNRECPAGGDYRIDQGCELIHAHH